MFYTQWDKLLLEEEMFYVSKQVRRFLVSALNVHTAPRTN